MFTPILTKDGSIRQSCIPKTIVGQQEHNAANGLMVRAVVVQVYSLDDDPMGNDATGAAIGSSDIGQDAGPPSTYCDVLTYSNLPGSRSNKLNRVLVPNYRGGLHEGRVWAPRPATINLRTGKKVNLSEDGTMSKNTNPAELDGDHVLIGFMDNDLTLPVIMNGIPHPLADISAEDQNSCYRTKLRRRDDISHGGPDMWRYRGVTYGISEGGNFVVDTSSAHQGRFLPDGAEPPASNDGRSGNVLLNLQAGATLEVTGIAGTITLDDEGYVVLRSTTDAATNRIELDRFGCITLSHWSNTSEEHTQIWVDPDGNLTTFVGANIDEDAFTRNIIRNAGQIDELIQGDYFEVLEGGDKRIETDQVILFSATQDFIAETEANMFLDAMGNWTSTVEGDQNFDTAGAVMIGRGAAHPVIHGDSLQSEHSTMDAKLSAFFLAFNAFWTALLPLLQPPAPSGTGVATWAEAAAVLLAPAQSVTTPLAQVQPAIDAFTAAFGRTLSSDVTSK